MQVIAIPCGPLGANAYLLTEPKSGLSALIDAPCADGRLGELIEDGRIHLRYLLLTHGHFDHILGAEIIRDKTGAKVGIHQSDAPCLKDPWASLAEPMGLKKEGHPSMEPDLLLADGDLLPLGDAQIQVIHTPGHTRGGVCYRCGDFLFTGDTLFAGSFGRTDFPGGNMEELAASCRRLASLAGDLRVLPGHGEETTLDAERSDNPILRS